MTAAQGTPRTGVDPRARTRRVGLTLGIVAVIVATGCGSPGALEPTAGAPRSTTATAPTAVLTPELPDLEPRIATSDPEAPSPPALQPLVDAITAALADTSRIPPNVVVTQKEDAGDQVVVSWTVSLDPLDASARENVRRDAVAILAVVKSSGVEHGSVLLAATGAVLQEGKKKVTVVVRAKYTGGLVRSIDWSQVVPESVFALCDDKPAVIATAFA